MIDDAVRLIARFADPLILAGVFLAASFVVKRYMLRRRPITRFVCQVAAFAAFTIMLVVAGGIPFGATPAMDHGFRFIFRFISISAFKIVWWLAAAWLLVGVFRAVVFFERQPMGTRLLQDLFAGVAYIGAILAIIAYVFDMPISGLLAASGVLAIVLGLALQSTLGDLFSGIVLNIAKPYLAGDWITLADGLEGRVVETNWRATHILTPNNDLAVVPNSVVAKAAVVNASSPTKAHGITVVVRLEPTVTPSHGCAVLETALLSCNRILRTPEPTVTVRALDAGSLECELQVFVPAIEKSSEAQNELFDLVYRHCGSAGIRLALPPGSSFTHPVHAVRREPGDAARRLLDHLAIFAPLTDEERTALAPKMRRRAYKAGDVLIEPGTVTEGLFILTSGALVARVESDAGDREVVRLSPGDCFGAAGVLTGAPTRLKVTALTKAVVYDIAKDDLAPILKERPTVAAELGQVLARRQAIGKARLEHRMDHEEQPGETFAGRLAERMKELFGRS
jgi:small-conductance mechanosensitive channel/CRP-like cAMP-binding protein